jgi:hypothetical protein
MWLTWWRTFNIIVWHSFNYLFIPRFYILEGFPVEQFKKLVEHVNHPKHYNNMPAECEACGKPIECIEVVRHLNFNLGNVIKYLWRCDEKSAPIEDLKKAAWYLADEIKQRETLAKRTLKKRKFFTRFLCGVALCGAALGFHWHNNIP